MLLATRDWQRQDIPPTTQETSFLNIFNTFKRSSLPHYNVSSKSKVGSTAGGEEPHAMSPSASSLSYANPPDRNNPADSARRNIGRQILSTRVADDEQKPTQSPSSKFGSGKESLLATNVSDPHNAPIGNSATFLTNAELYSNLATYSFGNPPSSSSSRLACDEDEETNISPLTPVTRRGSTDRTPRPSISLPETNNRSHPSHLSPQGQGRPRRSHRPPEAPETNDDSMADIDYQQRRGRGRVMSDTASQHTFGGGRGFGSSSVSVDNSRSPSRSSDRSAGHEFSSEEELDLDYEPPSLDIYLQEDFDPDDAPGSSRYSEATIGGRRGSLPMAIPGSVGSSSGAMDDTSRGREDSLITLRRPSRSLDDDLTSVVIAAGVQSSEGRDLSVEPASEPLSRADFRNLHDHIEQRQQQQPTPTPIAPSNDAYEAFDLNYIMGDMGSRRASLAPSYIQQQRELPQRQSRGFRVGGWGAGLQWNGGRRPSTATTGTTDDVFIRHAQRFDENYAFASLQWSFRREEADGRGPHVSSMSIRSEQSREPVPATVKQADSNATMVPGTQELWRHEFIGRFKIDRMALMSRQGDPTKPPQQRLHVRHIHDPFSKGNKAGGPSSVVHKHSKALAFSIFRHYALLTNNRSSSGTSPSNVMATRHANRTLPSTSGGIMLAPKNVQEQYTSTRTTAKLASHGLLGNTDGRNDHPRPSSGSGRRNASFSRREKEKKEKERKEKEKKQREKEEKAKAKAKKAQHKKRDMTESGGSTSTQASTVGTSSLVHSQLDTIEAYSTKVEERVRRNSANQVRQVIVSLPTEQSPTSDEPTESETSSSIISSSIGTRVSYEGSQGSRTAVSDQPGQPGRCLRNDDLHKDSTAVGFYQGSTTEGHDSTNEEDDDDERVVTVSRTPHAEAFTTLDPDVIEYVRSKGSRIAADGSISWTKRLFGRSAKSNASTPDYPVPSAAVREATYVPPWMTIVDRKVQESNEKLIQNLNESFKDVGLVHTLKPTKSSGKSSKRTDNNFFGDIGDDVLYMLLPLWAGETDAASTPPTSAIVTDTIPPMEDRLYLLVWYNPFESRPEIERNDNPRKKPKSSPNSSLDNKAFKSVFIPQFKVSARLVGYDELLGTGVRLPSIGLSVTGPLWEAMQDAPKSSLRQEHPGDCLLAICFGREKGIEFLPDGLEKVGLCLPGEVDQPYVPESDYQPMDVPERAVFLSAIGRAAAETIWLGCLALTSFGSV